MGLSWLSLLYNDFFFFWKHVYIDLWANYDYANTLNVRDHSEYYMEDYNMVNGHAQKVFNIIYVDHQGLSIGIDTFIVIKKM